ncbi:MAG TPA: hypothetical protein VFW94_07590 [Candidatus Acidoferrales bacterium]|nr:hypothetical protein [Candidatus Acidoferrales bacterium]
MVRRALWILGVSTAAIQAWAFRHEVSPDAVAYLDIARRFSHGHWAALVNAYWSPLYPLLLGTALGAAKPSLYWESTLAHALNLIIFAFSFVCFEFLLRELLKSTPAVQVFESSEWRPDWAIWAIGDTLFIYLTLLLIGVQRLSPDLLLAAFFYLAAGLIVRIHRDGGSWIVHAMFGAVLGIGYLAKAILFPLAWVFLACCLVLKPRSRSLTRTVIAMFVFCLLAGPYVWALSHAKGRFTFGDTGKIAYAEFVDGIQRYTHWQGSPGFAGTPVHPTHLVLAAPPVFQFSGPIKGTYPPWDDPSYWYDGVAPKFVFGDQLRAIRYTIEEYAAILRYMGALLVAFFALFFFAGEPRSITKNALACWSILLPAAAGLILYGALYVESRFVVPFFIVIWAVLFTAVRSARTTGWRTFMRSWTLALLFTLASGIIWLGGRAAFRALQPQPFTPWQVAEGLKSEGIHPNDRVASIGNGLDYYWAHLAGVRIVAEIPLGGSSQFWAGSEALRSRALQAFAAAGATALVSGEQPPVDLYGWHEVGGTGYYIFDLRGLHTKGTSESR